MSILTIGMSCLDLLYYISAFPEENRKIIATSFNEIGGGPCGNASYLLGLWKEDVIHVTTLKDDSSGDFLVKDLSAVNVDTSYIIKNSEQITPLSSILINENATRTIITYKNNGTKRITKKDEKQLDHLIEKLNSVDERHVILIDGHEYEVSEYVIPQVKNKVVVMDAGNLRESNLKLAKYTNYLVASEHFAQDFIKEKDLLNKSNQKKVLREIKKISHNDNTPVVTLGEYGVIALVGDNVVHYPAFSCSPLDTTGAGDIFHGAFCYGVNHSWDLERIVMFSSLTAVLSIEKKGVRDVMPLFEEVEKALMEYSLKSSL